MQPGGCRVDQECRVREFLDNYVNPDSLVSLEGPTFSCVCLYF
jgi:hypothetical protein